MFNLSHVAAMEDPCHQGINPPALKLCFDLSGTIPFSGGTVAIASHSNLPKLFVSVSELRKTFAVAVDSGDVLSTLDIPESCEDGVKGVAFDPSDGSIVLLGDESITCWRDGSPWEQVGEAVDISEDADGISVDRSGRILVDLSPPAWLTRREVWEYVPLPSLPEEPPRADDGDLDAIYKRQVWEATTVDLSNAVPVACADGGVFFYASDSKSAHYLASGASQAVELSRRRERRDAVRGLVVHVESDLPEQGCCCTSANGAMFIVGTIPEDSRFFTEGTPEGTLGAWTFLRDAEPMFTRLTGFRTDPPAQLDCITADAVGTLYLCVVEKWPDRRAIYCLKPSAEQ